MLACFWCGGGSARAGARGAHVRLIISLSVEGIFLGLSCSSSNCSRSSRARGKLYIFSPLPACGHGRVRTHFWSRERVSRGGGADSTVTTTSLSTDFSWPHTFLPSSANSSESSLVIRPRHSPKTIRGNYALSVSVSVMSPFLLYTANKFH